MIRGFSRRAQSQSIVNVKRWNVSSLHDESVDDQGELTAKGKFFMIVDDLLGKNRMMLIQVILLNLL